jgi:hypothetical protein
MVHVRNPSSEIMPLRLLANRGQAREGKQAMNGIQWPGRREWADRRRDPNWFDHIEVSNRLADYATQAEIDDAIAAIKDLWRALGRQMESASDIEALQFRYRRAGVNSRNQRRKVGR